MQTRKKLALLFQAFALPVATAMAMVGLGLWASPTRADVAPEGVKGVVYKITIANRAQYADHVLIVYPTSNSGFGYVLEEGKPITHLMMRGGWKGPATALYAMKRSDFATFGAGAHRYEHGDNKEMVTVVHKPPGPPKALVAAASIEPPPYVPLSSDVEAIERVYRIKALTAREFDLVLVEEVAVHAGGRREKRKVN